MKATTTNIAIVIVINGFNSSRKHNVIKNEKIDTRLQARQQIYDILYLLPHISHLYILNHLGHSNLNMDKFAPQQGHLLVSISISIFLYNLKIDL